MKLTVFINFAKIVFLVGIFTILIFPLTNINKETISTKENRSLASYSNLYDKKKKVFNLNYGKDFENWLKDRFAGRIHFINVYKDLKYFLSYRFVSINKTILDKDENSIYEDIPIHFYTQDQLDAIYKQLKIFNKYCQKSNIKLYVVAIPQKEMVYNPPLMRHDENTKIKKDISYIKNKSHTNFIFPIDDLIKAKKESNYKLYHKTDPHSTLDGTFIAYKRLMNEIQKDFPNVKPLKYSDFNYSFDKRVKADDNRRFNVGTSCKIMAGLSDSKCKSYLDTKYRYFQFKNYNELDAEYIIYNKLNMSKYYYPKGRDLKVLVFGDSFSENLMDILPFSFKHVVKIRLNKGIKGISDHNERFKILKYYENEILNIQPDIIIIYIGYNYKTFGMLKNLTLRK